MKVAPSAAGPPGGRPKLQGKLTERQTEILRLIARGHLNKQIAYELKISPKTVEFHRRRIRASLGAHSVADLIRLAIERGIIEN